MLMELAVIEDGYALAQFLAERVQRFPRSLRYTLGADISTACLDMLSELVRAKYAANGPAKRERLTALNTELEVLRFRLRLAHDLKALPHEDHRRALERLRVVGRQVGGWIKFLQARSAP